MIPILKIVNKSTKYPLEKPGSIRGLKGKYGE
jgi:hypothetical protein